MHLAVDASLFGPGAVISHITEEGEEHLIAYASCRKKNYFIIEKKALAIIFANCKFLSKTGYPGDIKYQSSIFHATVSRLDSSNEDEAMEVNRLHVARVLVDARLLNQETSCDSILSYISH